MTKVSSLAQPEFIPLFPEELSRLGWDTIDILLISGDAYLDHPACGAALLGRWLIARGWRVGIVAQPRWDRPDDVARLGRPRLYAGVTAGALDSLLAHYTAFRKKRSDDAGPGRLPGPGPGGRAGARPNRAVIVYAGLVRQAFPGLPVVIGGIEASLRRASHYDFWTDALRRSILLDAKADLLAYGPGERAAAEIAARLDAAGAPSRPEPELWRGLRGIVRAGDALAVSIGAETAELPDHETIAAEPFRLVETSLALERQAHNGTPWLVQRAGGRPVLLAPPAEALNAEELGELYGLPYQRRAHPSYREAIPALETIRFSVTAVRGCGGGCAFCSLALHQGRRLTSRRAEDIVAEVERLIQQPDWRGAISDVGGPTANLWGARCARPDEPCARESCLFPGICPQLRPDQAGYVALLRRLAELPGVRQVRVASGVRHDLAAVEPEATAALLERFVGGQLKLAPEHCAGRVLALMRKPDFAAFEAFLDRFARASAAAGREQYVVPYLLSALPGCTDADMRELAGWLAARDWRPQQVQCFIPTPGTVATAMYYSGRDPAGREIPVARTDAERLRQHAILLGEESADAGRPAKPKPAGPRRKRR